MLKDGTPDSSAILKLYQNNYTPADTSTAAYFTVANFTNYVNKTLTRTSWHAAVTNANSKAETSYGTAPESWTCGASGNTIYGYWVEGTGTQSGKVLWAERFATARVLANGDVLNITPKFTLTTES